MAKKEVKEIKVTKVGTTYFEDNRENIKIPNDTINEDDTRVDFFIQGERFVVKRGERVNTFPIVEEIYDECDQRLSNANKSDEKLVVVK